MNDYFRDLRDLGQAIDGDIRKLEKTWETPHILMCGYGENFEEASPYVESFLGTLKEIQDNLIEDRESRAKHITSTDEYLANTEIFYQDLKQQCQEVECLLTECGYKPLPEAPACSSLIESETETSILTPEQMENSISSPSFVCPDADEVFDTFVTLRNQPKSIATPVIKSLASVTKSAEFTRPNMTSTVDNSQKDFFSPYYGRKF